MTEVEIQLSVNPSAFNSKFQSLIRINRFKTMLRCGACFGLLLFVGNVYAQSLIVAVSGAQFTTYVDATGQPAATYPEVSRTTTSASPISDEIDLPVFGFLPTPLTNHAIANAGLLVVSAQTGWGKANASATSQLLFSPLVDQTQTIGIQISGVSPGPNTAGSISLLDLTSNSELWNYSWDMNFSAPVNFSWDSPYMAANFNVDTDFLASDQYELTMMTGSQAGDDSENIQIQLSGLVAVPEPSTTLFLAICGASFVISRRQRQ